jgi:uncharacterized protein
MAIRRSSLVTEAVFLDTNGWLALLNSSDALHTAAVAGWSSLLRQGCAIVVTDWVMAETGNGLARTPARGLFAAAVELLESSPKARVVEVDTALRRRALTLYSARRDKTWGLVDCASFVVMELPKL